MNKFKNGIGLFFAIVFLVGCSNGGSNSKETNSSKIKMGEILKSNNEHISYLLKGEEEINKDSGIDFYVLTKDGKTQVFDGTGDTTLGDVSKMDDNEIKKRMKEEDEKYFNEEKNDAIKSLKEGDEFVGDTMSGKLEKELPEHKDTIKHIKDYIDKHGNLPKKSLDKVKNVDYSKPKAFETPLAVETDGSGNNTKEEEFKFKAHGFSEDDHREDSDNDEYEDYSLDPRATTTFDYKKDLKLTKKYEGILRVTDIYDKKYAGLSYYDDDDEEFDYLITEVGDKVKDVKFDQPDDNYVDRVDGEKK